MNNSTLSPERRSTRSKPPTFPAGDPFGLRAVSRTLRRHRLLAGCAFACTLLAVLVYLWLAAPVWKADSLVQFAPHTRITTLAGLEPAKAERASDAPTLGGQMEVLRSRSLLLPVIAAVGADIDIGRALAWGMVPIGHRHGVVVQQLKLPPALLGRPLSLRVEQGRWQLASPEGALLAEGQVGLPASALADGEPAQIHVAAAGTLPVRLPLTQALPTKAYDSVLERLRVFEPGSDSGVLRLSYEGNDPVRVARLLNGLVLAFLEQDVARRKEGERQALGFLEDQLPALKRRVEIDEDALAMYREKHQTIPAPAEAEALLRQRAELARDLTLLGTRADQLGARLTPQHPELAAVREQRATVERSLKRVDADIQRRPTQIRDIARLEREVAVGNQMYTAALAQAQQLRLAVASRLPDARQLDVALPPVDLERPRAAATLSIGLALATLAALGAALLAQATRSTVTDADEVDARLGLRTLAHIPESRAERLLSVGRLSFRRAEDTGMHAMLARAAPNDVAVEALRAMQLAVRRHDNNERSQVVMVVAPVAGCGASFVASNLAALLAEAGQRVLLVEADLAGGMVHRYAGLDRNAAGLADVVAERRPLAEVLRSHGALGFEVLLPGAVLQSEAGLLQRPRLRELLQELRQRYDYIVLHAAPAQRSGHALAAALLADSAVLVVQADKTRTADIQSAVRLIEGAAIPLKGLVLNRVNTGRATAGPAV